MKWRSLVVTKGCKRFLEVIPWPINIYYNYYYFLFFCWSCHFLDGGSCLYLLLPRSFLTSTDKENMFTLDHFPVWYRRAAENPPGQFLYYLPRQDTRGKERTLVLLSKKQTNKKKTSLFATI